MRYADLTPKQRHDLFVAAAQMIERGDEKFSCCAVNFMMERLHGDEGDSGGKFYMKFLKPTGHLWVSDVERAARESRPDLSAVDACKQLRVMMLLMAAQAALTGDV